MARDKEGGGIRGLRGGRVMICDDDHSDVALAWLEGLLSRAGVGFKRDAPVTLEFTRSPSSCVLNVFFGKARACLVRKSVFESAAEMNPQVGRKLSVTVSSEAVVPSVFCFRVSLAGGSKEKLATEILRLNESQTGAQVLRMFKAERMLLVTRAEVDRSLLLLSRWRSKAGE